MFSMTMPNLFSFARLTIEAETLWRASRPCFAESSVLSVDASPDSRVVSLEVSLRLPASGFNLGRPAEVVAQDASVRVRRCHVVEVGRFQQLRRAQFLQSLLRG